MDPIEKIVIDDIQVKVNNPWLLRQPNVDNLVPPVILHIGNPIVNIPGCVKMHKDNKYHNNGLPIDRNLVEDDPNQVMTVCDAEVPSYDAMNYEPERMLLIQETPVPPVKPPPAPPEFEADEIPKTEEDVSCPGPGQLRVGDITQSGDERVTGHELSSDGKICITLYEPTTPIEKFLPSVNQATTTVAIAVVATAGAAATPLLIRIIKPVIKKLWTTVQKKVGKNVKQLTRTEIETNKYRKKKGLPPIKRK